MKAHAVVFEDGAGQKVDATAEIALIFDRLADASPRRSLALAAGPEQVQLFRAATVRRGRDVLRKLNLDRAIGGRPSWKQEPKTWLRVLRDDAELETDRILNLQGVGNQYWLAHRRVDVRRRPFMSGHQEA
jgi:hypothetical protein